MEAFKEIVGSGNSILTVLAAKVNTFEIGCAVGELSDAEGHGAVRGEDEVAEAV